tara:strand:+ start:36023 stop:38458 length:2436 start_codon:yes stop_codon:yes gene_type:complete
MISINDDFIISSSEGGIYKVDLNNLNFSDYSNNLEYIDINSIALHDNHYWLAGNDGNIQILDENFNLVNVIDYTNFSSIRKIVFYEQYAFAIGADLEGYDVLVQYSADGYPNYLNYITINDLLNTIPDCEVCPGNHTVHDIHIGNHAITLATTAGLYIADLSTYNHNLLSISLDWTSLVGDETLLIIDGFSYLKLNSQVNVFYSETSEFFPYPTSNLDIVAAKYFNGKLYSLFSDILYVSNLDGSDLQEFNNLSGLDFKDLLLIDNDIYIGSKKAGIIKLDNYLSEFSFIIPNTLFSNNITSIDINDNYTLAGLSGKAEQVLGGFVIDHIHTELNIKNFYSYNNYDFNYPVSNSIDNVAYNGKLLSYAQGNVESYDIKFNSKGDLYFLNSGIYLDPDNYSYDNNIEYISSLINLNPLTLEISNSWGQDVFSGKRELYPDEDGNCSISGQDKNHTIVTQLLFDNNDNAWIVNPHSEGDINKPVCAMINSQENNWVCIEDHNNPDNCLDLNNEYLLPSEVVIDYNNNLWIGYEKDINLDYSPGGLKMVKFKDILDPNDDLWYSNTNYSNRTIDVVGCADNESFHNISIFSLDIGKDSLGNTILWILTESGAMAYRVYNEGSRYKLEPQSIPGFCDFYLSNIDFDNQSKIRVDKQNNAWIISKEGVTVLSPQNPWEIKMSLNLETSNLLSNNIQDIAFDDNGYIYFATDRGLSIFQGIFATDRSNSSISVSPNPFMIGDSNTLTISNSLYGSIIQIMNLSGKVVKEFNLNEGNVILDWDGRGENGKYLNTGVYLLSGFHPSGSQGVTKLAIIRK